MSAFYTFILQNNFAIEFLLSFIPVIPVLKGRKFWYLILIPFIAGLIILSVFTFGIVMFSSVWLNVIWYLAVYVWAVAAVRLSFRVNFWQSVYTVTCAYTLQHMFYKFKRLIDFAFSTVTNAVIWTRVLYLPAIIAVYLVFYFIFVRRVLKQNSFEINNTKLLIVTVAALFIITFVNLYFERYFFSMYMFNGAVSACFSVLGIVCCLLILHNLYDNIHNEKVQEELRILNTLWENDKRQYEIFKSSVGSINIKYHDLKYALKSIGTGVNTENGEWLKDTIDSLDVFGAMQKTGSEALDVLLVGIQPQCNEADIRLTVSADGGLLGFMNDIDVYSLMGNALDNALECAKKETGIADRYINVTVKQLGAMVKIQIENCSTENIKIVNGFPVTTKPDAANHGFGVKSIALITERYGGIYHFEASGGAFILEVMLPLKNEIQNQI